MTVEWRRNTSRAVRFPVNSDAFYSIHSYAFSRWPESHSWGDFTALLKSNGQGYILVFAFERESQARSFELWCQLQGWHSWQLTDQDFGAVKRSRASQLFRESLRTTDD